MKISLLFAFLILGANLFGQMECFTIDKESGIAYDAVDSSFYSGNCSQSYKNGNMKSVCQFESGIIKYAMKYNKKGELIDSVDYLNGHNRFNHFEFYANGAIKSSGIFYLCDTSKMFDGLCSEGLHINYYKNGNVKLETQFYKSSTKMQYKSYDEEGIFISEDIYYAKDTIREYIILPPFRENSTLEFEEE